MMEKETESNCALGSKELIDLEKDKISREEISHWDTEALKEYCKVRGLKVSGSRTDLIARVYVLYNANIAANKSLKQQEASKRKDYSSLYKMTIATQDPWKIKTWRAEKEGIANWPSVSYIDIDRFMRENGSVGLTGEGLTAYKTGKAYSYFSCNFLGEVFFAPLTKNHRCCYVKAKCTPSNRLHDEPHNLWVKLLKTGEIISAYCSCVAGLSQTCNHVASLLYKMEAAFRLGMSNPTCTMTPCSWKAPSGTKAPPYMKVSDMNFVKPAAKKQLKLSSVAGTSAHKIRRPWKIRIEEDLVRDNDTDAYKSFVEGLKSAIPNASVFLPGIMRRQLSIDQHDFEIDSILCRCKSVNDFKSHMTINADSINTIERETRGQSSNDLWKTLRKGRITASNFYRVMTKMETVRKKPTTDCSVLIKSLLNPPFLGYMPQIQTGLALEKDAVQEVIMLLSQTHKDISYHDCGLFLHPDHPFLGASPDGILTCKCCPPRLLEIKCPSLPVKELGYLDDEKKLKTRSVYYGQIQGQMAVTGIQQTYFFIYTDKESIIQVIDCAAEFCVSMVSKLQNFYLQFMLPQLMADNNIEPPAKKKRSV